MRKRELSIKVDSHDDTLANDNRIEPENSKQWWSLSKGLLQTKVPKKGIGSLYEIIALMKRGRRDDRVVRLVTLAAPR